MALFNRKKDDGLDAERFEAELDTAALVLVNYPPGTTLSFGAPVRCPLCADFGLVEQIDQAAGRSHNRCFSCSHQWVMTQRALRSARLTARTSFDVFPTGVSAGFDSREVMASGGVLFTRGLSGEVDRVELDERGESLVPAALLVPEETLILPRGPMRVLLVEDNPNDRDVVQALLEPAGPSVVDLRWASTRAAGEAAARSDEPDLVLLDLGLPDSHGFQTMTQWHFSSIDVPVLVVSGGYSPNVVERGHEFGVTGFIDKSELAELLAAGDEGATAFLDRLETAASV